MQSLLFIDNNRFVKSFKNSMFIEIEVVNETKKQQTNIYFINQKGKIIDTMKKPYISIITGVFLLKNIDISDTINHIKVSINESCDSLELKYNIREQLEYISKTSYMKCKKLNDEEILLLKSKNINSLTNLI